MAHRGKTYKLLFRRDLCLGCTNYNFSLPQAFHVALRFDRNPPAFPVSQNITGNAVCNDPPTENNPTWILEGLSFFGKPADIHIQMISFNNPDQKNNFRLAILDGLTEVGSVQKFNDTSGRCGVITYTGSFGGTAIVIDPAWWGTSGVTLFGTLTGATWLQFP